MTTMASDAWGPPYSCPVCSVTYFEDEGGTYASDIHDHFRNNGWAIEHRDLLAHATALADVIRRSRTGKPWPMMRVLYEVISRARYFVHFTSWGISHLQIGALKMASMRVPIYGFVSNVDAAARAELTEFPEEAPNFHAKVIATDQTIYDAPHQKIVVVDGLLAFKGSTNLTNAGVRRADRGLDLSEVVTDFVEVTELNNKYFAPVWKKITSPDDAYVIPSWPF